MSKNQINNIITNPTKNNVISNYQSTIIDSFIPNLPPEVQMGIAKFLLHEVVLKTSLDTIFLFDEKEMCFDLYNIYWDGEMEEKDLRQAEEELDRLNVLFKFITDTKVLEYFYKSCRKFKDCPPPEPF